MNFGKLTIKCMNYYFATTTLSSLAIGATLLHMILKKIGKLTHLLNVIHIENIFNGYNTNVVQGRHSTNNHQYLLICLM